jgi:hypothetical protein
MRRANSPATMEDAGSDSFLDIVSNIVGILILLVMIVGARIKDVLLRHDDPPAISAAAPVVPDTAALETRAVSLVAEIERFADQVEDLELTLDERDAQRREHGTLIATVEKEINQSRAKLDEESRRRLDLSRELVVARSRLHELEQQQISAVSTTAAEVQIESYPTPISKTVFKREEHYRVSGGRLVRVPFDELKEILMRERTQVLWKLEDLPEVAGTVGPIDGFRLRYHFARISGGGTLTKAEFLPVSDDLGEPLASALAPNSRFRREVAGLDRTQTTITIWTYPDSYAAFRELKRELYRLGFDVAARPMPKDARIGFSPQGSRSAAQ